MSDITLGLDLGSNSIGWALVDETGNRLVATGVRVFPEGVDRDQQGGEKSKNEERRIARGMRRQIARRARRKRQLRLCLQGAGLLPPDVTAHAALEALDPYELRRRALEERLEPFEIGRVLIHLNQRRGFLSNRKTDRARKNDNKGMLAEISALAAEIETSGRRSLGDHFASLRAVDPLVRVRGKHTRRVMYECEFKAIWDAQVKHHSALLAEELREMIHRIVFFQRDMYWPKSVVGVCELEPKKKRCPRADRVAQRFRLLQEVNNLRLLDCTTGEERSLTPDERSKLIEVLERKKELSFDDIRKRLNLYEHVRFNFERAERKKLDGMPTDVLLAHKDRFGKRWYELPDEHRNAIVRVLLSDDETVIREKAVNEWSLAPEQADRVLDTDLGEGYASYSREAIEKLLPHLERGLPLMTRDDTSCALREAGYLRPDQCTVNQRNTLPLKLPDVTNPLVRQALHEVRRVVNAIIHEYGIPARIHIEMAREVKGTADQRAQMTKDNRQRAAERDRAAEEIRKLGVGVTRDAIDRYLLWTEQKEMCIYSGRPISLAQLLGGEVDVDHILPRHRSLDNSFMNRVVCFRDENRDKGDRTPYEWLAASNPSKFEAVLQRARHLPYAKLRKFRLQDIALDEFVARQLNDTAYITSKVLEYVRCLGADVVCTKGQLTSDLRRNWGLNTVLRHDNLDIKNRDDHRHHAVDAIVIALMNRSRLHHLSNLYKPQGARSDALDPPWVTFRDDVERAVNGINVSHRARRKVRGALHEETIYGSTHKPGSAETPDRPRSWAKNWIEDAQRFVYRKPLESLTLAMIDDIRDEAIRNIVIDRLKQFGLNPGDKKKIPAEVWKDPLRMPSGVAIKKVRLLKKDRTIQPIREGAAFVKTGSTHHLCLFEFQNKRGNSEHDAVFVSMLEAAKRLRGREPLYQRTHPTRLAATFLMTLAPGDSVLACFEDRERLMILRTAVSTEKKFSFVDHTDSRLDKEIKKYRASDNTFRGRRVTVDVLGRIHNAND